MRDKLTAAGAEAGCPGVFCFWKAKAGYTFNYNYSGKDIIGDKGCGDGSIPTINTIFRGMNIHLPAILMFTSGTRF